jgi:hypothetical protein
MTTQEPTMFSSLCFGFFDPIRLGQHELVVRQPLDSEVIGRAFREWGGTVAEESGEVDGHRFILQPEGFLESTSVLATRRVVDFVASLVRETRCEIAVPSFGGTISLESVVANFERLESIFAAPADESRAVGPIAVPGVIEEVRTIR